MKCQKCQNEGTIQVTKADMPLCKKHFVERIEKRIRKDLRTRQNLDTKKTYTIRKENTAEYKITKHFLEKIFNKHLKLKDTKKNADIETTNLDQEASKFLETFMRNAKTEEKAIKPLRKVTQKEIEALSRILNIKQKNKKTNGILEKLENLYPGTNFSTTKTKEFLEDKKNKKTN